MIAPKTSYRRAPLSRRMLLLTLSLSAIGAGLGLSALPVLAETKGPTEVPVEELMKPGPMGEITLGKPDAKVTIVEYASMTCGHCAHFTKEIWPELKKKYVDSGKAYYIFREFPLDNLAAAASDARALHWRRQDHAVHRGDVRAAEGVGLRGRQSGAEAV